MKYTSDQQGIMNRYLAEGNHWEDHLYRTRTFIARCLEGSGAESVAVLGSGWLLDLPFEYLRDNFTALYLVDIVHPAQIVNKTKGMENVHLVRADITGGAVRGAYNLVQQFRKTGEGRILDIACRANTGGVKPDFVISLNILNQLDILLVDYVSRFMNIPEEDKSVFRKRIQQQHVDLLTHTNSCLISDMEERLFTSKGELAETRQLVYAQIPPWKNLEEWIWDFDTLGGYNQGFNTFMKVQAVQF